jgi:hydroxymethylbilane synthase
LGFDTEITDLISPEVLMPAVGQGAIAIEIRNSDMRSKDLLAMINSQPAWEETMAERAFLAELEGGCQVPVACLARVYDQEIRVHGLVASLDGKIVFKDHLVADRSNVMKAGQMLAERLLNQGAGAILEEIRKTIS